VNFSRLRPRFKSIDIRQVPSFEQRAPSNRARVTELLTQLDAGEAEAIALAEELLLDLLIDEKAGRNIAQQLGVRVTGVIGVWLEAKTSSLIPAVMPHLERLQSELGFYIAPQLLEKIRRSCSE
jgi:predicted nucleic acid-binding protein